MAQRVDRALDTHAQRGTSRPRDGRHLFVFHVVHVPKQERFALVGGEIGEYPIHVPDERFIGSVVFGTDGDLGKSDTVFDDGVMSLPFDGKGATPIPEDAEEPRIEDGIGFKSCEVVMNSNKRILHCLLGIFPISQHVHRETQGTRVVVFHEQGEAGAIALPGMKQRVSIDGLHRSQVRGLEPDQA